MRWTPNFPVDWIVLILKFLFRIGNTMGVGCAAFSGAHPAMEGRFAGGASANSVVSASQRMVRKTDL
jgi:hypothetical protein